MRDLTATGSARRDEGAPRRTPNTGVAARSGHPGPAGAAIPLVSLLEDFRAALVREARREPSLRGVGTDAPRACRTAFDEPESTRTLGVLLERLHAPIYRFVRARVTRCVAPDDLAADVTQETLVHLARGAAACHARTDRAVMAWALTCARRALLDARDAQPMVWMPAQFVLPPEHAGLHVGVEEAAGRPLHADEGMERLLEMTCRAYATLSEDTMALFWSRLIGAMEWAELAEQEGAGLRALQRRYQRAQARVRGAVEAELAALDIAAGTPLARVLRRLGIGILTSAPRVSAAAANGETHAQGEARQGVRDGRARTAMPALRAEPEQLALGDALLDAAELRERSSEVDEQHVARPTVADTRPLGGTSGARGVAHDAGPRVGPHVGVYDDRNDGRDEGRDDGRDRVSGAGDGHGRAEGQGRVTRPSGRSLGPRADAMLAQAPRAQRQLADGQTREPTREPTHPSTGAPMRHGRRGAVHAGCGRSAGQASARGRGMTGPETL